MTVVTYFQGYCECQFAPRFSLTSTTTHPLTKDLLLHYLDLKHYFVCAVCGFVSDAYDYDKRV